MPTTKKKAVAAKKAVAVKKTVKAKKTVAAKTMAGKPDVAKKVTTKKALPAQKKVAAGRLEAKKPAALKKPGIRLAQVRVEAEIPTPSGCVLTQAEIEAIRLRLTATQIATMLKGMNAHKWSHLDSVLETIFVTRDI